LLHYYKQIKFKTLFLAQQFLFIMKLFTQKLTTFIAFIALACASLTLVAQTEKQSETERINAFFEDFFNETVAFYPEYQTYLGITDNNDKWNNYTAKFERKMNKRNKKALRKFKKMFDRSKLDPEAQLSYDLFVKDLELELFSYQYRLYDYPVNQMFGMHSTKPAFLINIQPVKDLKGANDYIARLNGFDTIFNELVKGLKKREKAGIVAPKFVFPMVIDDSKNVISGKPFDPKAENDSPLLADFKKKIADAKLDNQDALVAQAVDALMTSVYPA